MILKLHWLSKVALILFCSFAITACDDDRTRPAPLVSAPSDGALWPQKIAQARRAVNANPSKSEYRTALLSAIQDAEDFYIETGRRFLSKGNIDMAEGTFSRGLVTVPESQLLRDELQGIKDKKKSNAYMAQGQSSLKLGRNDRAINQLERALQFDPNNRNALKLLNRAYGSSSIHEAPKSIRLKSSAPVTVNFRDADMKEAFLTLGKNYGLNTIFDSGLDDAQLSLYAEEVSFDQAFRLMLKASGNHFRPMGKNSVLIFKDSAEARAKNTDYHVRTFFLETAQSEQIRALVERVLEVTNVTANTENNSITVRTTREKLALADRLIRSNDRRLAEVSMEVEILEINRTKSENLGVDIGSQITIAPSSLTVGDLTNGGSRAKLDTSIVTLPASSIKFFKQDVDARTLASPRIRTVSQKPASIHIGDRVPLRSATVLDANGQSRTSFEYRDVGIKLEVTPKVLLDNTVDVALNLEVSSLGQNLGTADESAFSIGTRNVETNMVLNDNETAIIGGLIRDEERATKQTVPGLGEIPLIGKIFQVRDGQGTRTDILLTLTPRIVKGWDIPSPADTEFYSGTGSRVGSQNELEFLSDGAPGGAVIRLDISGKGTAKASTLASPVTKAPAKQNAPTTTANSAKPRIGFNKPIYEIASGGDTKIRVNMSDFEQGKEVAFRIRFNKDIVQVKSASQKSGSGADIKFDNAQGLITVSNLQSRTTAQAVIGDIVMVGKKAGLSYFIVEDDDSLNSGSSKSVTGSAKIVVK
jgi:general secretion pathway protein D